MKNLSKLLFVVLFFNLNFCIIQINGQVRNSKSDNLEFISPPENVFSDSATLRSVVEPEKVYNYILLKPSNPGDKAIFFVDSLTLKHRLDSIMSLPLSPTDSLLYVSNPLFLPLVYIGKEIKPVWNADKPIQLADDVKNSGLNKTKLSAPISSEDFVADLRRGARDYISNNEAELYVTTIDRLPDLSTFMSRPIRGNRVNPLNVYEDKIELGKKKIELDDVDLIYWIAKANAMLQFSQNYVSTNWYQGGNSNFAFLSIFNAELNYDNLKNVQWENRVEWRAGFSSVIGNTTRKVMTNDDILRYSTKFGVRAGGNWYYSISGDLSTQLFDSYKSITSDEFKTRLFTPVRANVGVGMDYKYKKIFSLMLAPVSFKYIYVNDTIHVNPNLFGIKKGENQMKQIGSSLRAQLDLTPVRNWDIDSKLTFYTDYKKVEIDWEIVNNFVINRFLSTRISINPRYDNTIILKEGEKTKVQLKELMSFGLAFRFI
ncbi:MAG: DUF3078 domain-containing protein [Paludibacteraceae bacterium]